jgi:hypothetical protein
LQAAFRKFFGRYCNNLSYFPIQPFVGPHVVWCFISIVNGFWHTDLDYGSYLLPNLEIGLTAGVTGRQGMLTPPWHLIPPLIYSEVCLLSFSDLYARLMRLITVCSFFFFISFCHQFISRSVFVCRDVEKRRLLLRVVFFLDKIDQIFPFLFLFPFLCFSIICSILVFRIQLWHSYLLTR